MINRYSTAAMSDNKRRKPYHSSIRHQRRIAQENNRKMIEECLNEQLDPIEIENVELWPNQCDSLRENDRVTAAENMTDSDSSETHWSKEFFTDYNQEYVQNVQNSPCYSSFFDDATFCEEINAHKLLQDETQTDDKKTGNLREDLSDWALGDNLTRKTINDILNLLLRHFPTVSLPQDARTLLKTPRKSNMNTEHYWRRRIRSFWIRKRLRFICKCIY